MERAMKTKFELPATFPSEKETNSEYMLYLKDL
jgi:hypothetical protein